MRQVDAVTGPAVRPKCHRIRHQRIHIIAAYPPQHIRKAIENVAAVARPHCQKPRLQIGQHAGWHNVACIAEARLRAVRHDGVDGGDIVTHHAIADRPATAAVIAGHAADGCPAGGRDIDRKPQPVRLQLPVQLVKNNARLDKAAALFDIKLEDAVQMSAGIHHDGIVHRLPALRGAPTTRQYRQPLLACEIQCRLDIGKAFRHHHRMRHHLVDRGVGGVAAARERIVEQRALKRGFQRVKGRDANVVRHGFTR